MKIIEGDHVRSSREPTAPTSCRSTIRSSSTIRSPTWRSPGFWTLTDKEAENFRAYLKKGGFVIFDDFRGYDWDNLQAQMRRVLPEGRWIELDGTQPIFHSFFEIDDPLSLAPPYGGLPPSVLGHLRGQRPDQASRSRSPTSTATSASTGNGPTPASRRSISQRSVQVRRQLPDVWDDTLTRIGATE